MFIDGKFVESKATEWIDLSDPATNEVVTRVPKCTQSEMEQAVESSKRAYKVEFLFVRCRRLDYETLPPPLRTLLVMEPDIDFDASASDVQIATHHSSEYGRTSEEHNVRTRQDVDRC